MSNIKFGIFTVLKYVLVVCVLVFLITQMSAGRVSRAAFEDVAAEVTAVSDLSPMQEAGEQMIRRLYGLNPGDYEGFMLYCPSSNMGAEELLVVKLADMSQQETVRQAIEARLQTQLNGFEGYGVEQTAMLQNSIIEVRGNYLLFVSAADPSVVAQAFRDAL